VSVGKELANTPRPRLQLDSLTRVRREAVKLYREGRDGLRDVSEVSKLTHCLDVIRRMTESSELEQRIEALEQQAGRRP
jgi:hypothetical protein